MAPSDPLEPILGCPGGSKHYKNQWFFNVFAFRIFGLPGLLWSPLGSSWCPSGALLAPLGPHLGAQGLPLGPLGGPLGSLGQLLEPPKPLLDPSWGHLGGTVCPIEPPWCHHDPFWSSQMAFRVHFGPILHHFRSNFHGFGVGRAHAKHRTHKHTLERNSRSIEFTNTRWNETREASNSQTPAGTKLEIRATGEESIDR